MAEFEIVPEDFEIVPEKEQQLPTVTSPGIRDALSPLQGLTAPGAARIAPGAVEETQQELNRRAQAVTEAARAQGLDFKFESLEAVPEFNIGRAFRVARKKDFISIFKQFKEFFPNGDVKQVPDPDDGSRSVLLARTEPDQPYRLLSERSLGPVAAAVASEQTAGGIIGGILGGMVGRPFLGVAIGTGAGVGAREAIEPTGRTAMDTIIDGATEGVFAGVFGKGSELVFRVLRAGQGQGFAAFFKLRPGATEMVDAAGRRHLPPLMFGQLAQSPLIRGMLAQTAVISPRLEMKTVAQTRAVFRELDTVISKMGGFAGLSDESIETIVLAQRRSIAALEKRVFKSGRPVSNTDRRLIAEILDSNDKAITALRNRRFAAARKAPGAADIEFRTDGINTALKTLELGVPGRDASGALIRRLGGEVPDTASGKLLSETVDKLQNLIRVKGLPKTTILSIKTFTEGGKKVFAFDQLVAVRTALRKVISDPDSGLTPAQRLQVINLDRAVGRSLENPLNVTSREAAQKLADAIAISRFQGTILVRGQLVKDLAEDNIENIARNVISGRLSVEGIRHLRRISSPAQFAKFKDFIKLELLRDPKRFQERLLQLTLFGPTHGIPSRFAPRFQLFNSSEIRAMRALNRANSQARSNKIVKMLDSDLTEAERALKAALQPGGRSVQRAVTTAGGRLSALGRSIKAGVFQKILMRATEAKTIAGEPRINANRLLAAIKDTRQTVALKYPGLFTEKDWSRLADIQNYTVGLSVTADIGGGMMGGAIRANIGRLLVGGIVGGAAAGRTAFSQGIVARILTSPVHADRLARFAGAPMTPVKLFALAGIIKSVQRQMENDAESLGVTDE